MSDLGLALRMIRKQPGMAALAIVALALGIGLTTTMFSIVNGAVLRGLPFDESNRILHVAPFNIADQDDGDTRVHTYAEFVARQQSFEQLAAFQVQLANVVGPDGMPERYQGARLTANMLRLLRVTPALGRDFVDADSRPGAEPVVLIGHRVWQERFDGAPDVVGQALRVNGVAMTVVGVMPESFRFPTNHDIWPALVIDPDNTAFGEGPGLEVIGRLRPGGSHAQASAEMATLWQQLQLEFPDRYEGYTTEVKTYIEEFIGSETVSALYTMLAAVFGVLVIACANVANLVLARAADRGREIAVRTALGAGRARVMRQMLVEVLVLAAIGAAGGVAIAQAGITLFNRAIVDTNPPFWIDIRLDQTVLLFVVVASAVAALAAGIVPALRASRSDLMALMNDEGRGNSSLRMGRFSRGLVVVEMAVSFGLLVVSALVIQSIVNVSRADFGFTMADVWTARVAMTGEAYAEPSRRTQFVEALLPRLEALPGARSAAVGTGLPMGGPRYALKLPGRDYATERDYHQAHGLIVSGRYFETLGVAVDGRTFTTADTETGAPVVIVNQAFARTYFPQGAVGQQLALATGDDQAWRTIVGIVPDLGMGQTPGDGLAEAIYLPVTQVSATGLGLFVRATGAPLNLTAAARDAVRAIDPNLPIFNVLTVRQSLDNQTWAFRVFGTLFMAFGFAALFLATVGLYGVMSFAVSRRTSEIGVRMALGAAGRDVLRLVLAQGLWQVGVGILLGAGLAAALGSAMSLLFFGVQPRDPATYVVVGAVLAATGLVACLIPARRAARVDPMEALRVQ
ncbi:MAG: ABC transporter permease [Vicinamibacteria bacterium]